MRRTALVLAIAALALGCRAGYTPTIVLGPYPTGALETRWERALAAVREADYEPSVADPARGRIVLPSRAYGSREPIVVQLYRDGWVEVSVGGDPSSKQRWRGNADLAQEHLELCFALRESMEEPAERTDDADRDAGDRRDGGPES